MGAQTYIELIQALLTVMGVAAITAGARALLTRGSCPTRRAEGDNHDHAPAQEAYGRVEAERTAYTPTPPTPEEPQGDLEEAIQPCLQYS